MNHESAGSNYGVPYASNDCQAYRSYYKPHTSMKYIIQTWISISVVNIQCISFHTRKSLRCDQHVCCNCFVATHLLLVWCLCCSKQRLTFQSMFAALTHWLQVTSYSVVELVMTCRQFGANPFSEPVLTRCQLNNLEQATMAFES